MPIFPHCLERRKERFTPVFLTNELIQNQPTSLRLKKPHYYFVGLFVLKKKKQNKTTTSPPQIQIVGVHYSIVPRF